MSSPWIVEDASVYHAKKDHMSATQLKLLSNSARHYKKLYLDQIAIDTEDDEPTRAMRIGRMIHYYLLEPEKFRELYAFLPDKASEEFKDALFTVEQLKVKAKELNVKVSGRKEELIERLLEVDAKLLIWDRHISELTEGKEAITVENQKMLLEIFDAIKNYPQAMKLIKDGVPEVSGYWHDDEFDLKCKFRTDWINDKGYIVEVKSTASARKKQFRYKILDMRYDIGAAWYVRGYKKLMNQPPKGYVWLAIETKPPYCVALYTADDSCLSMGEYGGDDESLIGYRDAIALFKESQRTNLWPGFQKQIEDMSIISY